MPLQVLQLPRVPRRAPASIIATRALPLWSVKPPTLIRSLGSVIANAVTVACSLVPSPSTSAVRVSAQVREVVEADVEVAAEQVGRVELERAAEQADAVELDVERQPGGQAARQDRRAEQRGRRGGQELRDRVRVLRERDRRLGVQRDAAVGDGRGERAEVDARVELVERDGAAELELGDLQEEAVARRVEADADRVVERDRAGDRGGAVEREAQVRSRRAEAQRKARAL